MIDPAGPGIWLARPYPQLLRGPGYRWWRPWLSLLLVLLAAVALLGSLAVAIAGYELVADATGEASFLDDLDPWLATPTGLLASLLLTAAGIPIAMAAVWGGFGWRPRWVSSVTGGLRWRWMLRCALLVTVVTTVPGVALVLLSEDLSVWTPEPGWPLLAVIVLLAVPLQAAGEEYLFRGWLLQAVGAAFRGPVVGALVGGAVSSLLFALAHGQQNLWLFLDRFAFGVIAAWLVWRTGGLEAAIAFHTVNNLTVFGLVIAEGGLGDALAVTQAGAVGVAVDVATMLLAAAVVTVAASRRKIVRLHHPRLPSADR